MFLKAARLCVVLSLAGSCLASLRASAASPEAAGPLKIHSLSGDNESILLTGRGARQQLIATFTLPDGADSDCTRTVVWAVDPAGLVQFGTNGSVSALKDGKGTLVARDRNGNVARVPVEVRDSGTERPIHFINQIVPIFTKNGCNGGGCHGKSGGQNGFRLSLLGFEPMEDYEFLVKESRGRRLFTAAPEQSLLLQKATGLLPHGGGKRIEKGSADYELLTRWISQGMPLGDSKAPRVAGIEVFPKARRLASRSSQQLQVIARYTDGTTEDVTPGALYEANDKELAQTDPTGYVRALDQSGDVAVMVRYQSQVAVFRATIPKGALVEQLPASRNFIDELVFRKLKEVGMPPSAPCDDATFLRRVTLDIAGRLPTREETESFLKNQDPARRDRWIEALLAGGDYADYFANKWSALLRNRRDNGQQARGSFEFHTWIRESLYANKPFDQFVREILTASGDVTLNPPVAWYRQVRETKSQLEDTAQLFLGTRLQCAQCHHHPYERWSQQDYYGFAAFFSRLGKKAGDRPGEEVVYHRRGNAEATNIKTKKAVRPTGLGGAGFEMGSDDDPRQSLADWTTSPKNPFFARALVNRYWKHFFNKGLVDPEDDMRETNPPSHPELLQALADHFVQSGYDLKELVRTICRSQVYQLSSLPNEYNEKDKYYFSRYYPRRMTAEVLLDAIDRVTGTATAFPGMPPGTRAVQLPDNSFNAQLYFLSVFGRPESSSACECERSQDASLAQSLHLINSKELQGKVSAETSRAGKWLADPRPESEKIGELYLTAVNRPPDNEEVALAISYVGNSVRGKEGEAAKQARRQAYEDLVWVMVGTKEFLFNH